MRLRELVIGALRQGSVPEHVAFVMDGNRRYARRSGIETVEGHNLGFEALARVSNIMSAQRLWTNLFSRGTRCMDEERVILMWKIFLDANYCVR